MENDLERYVMNYFDVLDPKLNRAASALSDAGLDNEKVIDILSGVWRVAYDRGWDEANYYMKSTA